MDLENSKAQLRKGILEFCILSIISKREIYASDMIEQLSKANLIVVEGTLYPLLTRLKNAGLLSYKWVESQQGPPRKYYQITQDGLVFLNELQQSWDDMVFSVKALQQQNIIS